MFKFDDMSENNAKTKADNKANVSNITPSGPVTVPKTVTVFRKEGGSAYYSRNAKFIPEGKVKIGSAINSVNRMKASVEELDVYMPHLLGVHRNDPKYNEQVDLWFNNISQIVPETGLNLEIGFTYKDEESKRAIESVEEEIYNRFNSASKKNPKERDAAIDLRDTELINLEKTKYKYGSPINLGNYLLWRYCLVYTDVANDIALVNKSGGIRFYIYDSLRERHKEKLQFEVRKQAMVLFVKLLEMPDKVENMLWVEKGANVDITKIDDMDRSRMLENMSKANPASFIKLYSDVNLDIKATIERMIHFGILKRLPGTSVIVDEHNDIIGNTMDDSIAFFKNEERNKAAITRFKAKLRDYHG
jgi:hypothetical protein